MIVIVMGISGTGKSTVGSMLAEELGWPFVDADDHHPSANIRKMAAHQPLTDDDRQPWLRTLAGIISDFVGRGASAVVACSALKERYRALLRVSDDIRFVHLRGSPELLKGRLETRQDHFMPVTLLESQLADLEDPGDSAVQVGADRSPREAVRTIRQRLGI